MPRPIDAIVTGFTKNAPLCEKSLAPLRALRREGLIRAIHYVTWDGPGLDAFVAPVAAMEDVHLLRVPEPRVSGSPGQVSVLRQVAALEPALGQVAEDEALVVKSRPDFVFSTDFLRRKLTGFDTLCAVPRQTKAFGTAMPPPVFQRKVWIPWADANQPFFYEDAAFIGLKRDLAHLVTRNIDSWFAPLTDAKKCGSFGHAVRFAPVFLARYPIFRRYLAEYSVFVNDLDYRKSLVAMMIEDGFFWHLAVAHAWILHTSFHIDCGEPGELSFYPNTSNGAANWSSLDSVRLGNPYDDIDNWRRGTRGGLDMLAAVSRAYGRLLDDSWPRAMFTAVLPDFPVTMLQQIARGIAAYSTGLLNELEEGFYTRLRSARHNWLEMPDRGITSSPMLANARRVRP
jgi:hypothetical protein